jgi:hypothetical protein
MFLTRLGVGAKAMITGDVTQVDLPPGRVSGLVEARIVVSAVPGIRFVEFDDSDVVRHPLVQGIVKAYEAHREAAETALSADEPADHSAARLRRAAAGSDLIRAGGAGPPPPRVPTRPPTETHGAPAPVP